MSPTAGVLFEYDLYAGSVTVKISSPVSPLTATRTASQPVAHHVYLCAVNITAGISLSSIVPSSFVSANLATAVPLIT